MTPDRGFTARHREVAADLLATRLPHRERIGAVVLSGSRAAGLGHAESDLDVYVLLPDEETRTAFRAHLPPSAELEERYGVRIDVNPLTVPQVRGFGERLAGFPVRIADRRDLWATQYEYYDWSRTIRLVIGERVFATAAGHDLLAGLDRTVLRRWLMAMWSARQTSLLEDASGAVRTGDHLTALAAAEATLRCALEVALVGLDDLYLGDKFLWRRMANHPDLAGLLDDGDLFGLGGRDPETVVRHRLWLAGHLSATTLLSAWSAPVRAVPAPAVPDGGPRRSPYRTLLRLADGFVLGGLDDGVVITEETARRWCALDGRPWHGEVPRELRPFVLDAHRGESGTAAHY
ncbi:nucleotidyltransferase domain-containing protein [Umezawaea sp.]|uniref:nucleotidyltransferase domain-containing protein n=1 Tax=Umezawaea sp. TaxID=1955258 RepID=UPI002ED32DB5